MKAKTYIAIFALLALFAFIQAEMRNSERSLLYDTAEVFVGDASVRAFVADSGVKRVRGLGGMEPLAPDKGMLFVFPTEDFHGIWMQDMLFSIDIIWLRRAQTGGDAREEKLRSSAGDARSISSFLVVDIKENALPETFPEIFYPQAKAQYVLEVRSGFVREQGLSEGEDISARMNEKTRR